jgi:hypothetical protein
MYPNISQAFVKSGTVSSWQHAFVHFRFHGGMGTPRTRMEQHHQREVAAKVIVVVRPVASVYRFARSGRECEPVAKNIVLFRRYAKPSLILI